MLMTRKATDRKSQKRSLWLNEVRQRKARDLQGELVDRGTELCRDVYQVMYKPTH